MNLINKTRFSFFSFAYKNILTRSGKLPLRFIWFQYISIIFIFLSFTFDLKIIEEDSAPWFRVNRVMRVIAIPSLPSPSRFYGETIISRKLCAENGGEYSSGKLSLAVLLSLSLLSSNFFRLFHSAVIDKALLTIAKFFAFSSPLFVKDRPLYLWIFLSFLKRMEFVSLHPQTTNLRTIYFSRKKNLSKFQINN